MNDTCKEWIGNRDYVTFGVDTKIPYGLLSTDSNILQTILTIQDLKNSVFRFTMAAPMLLATYSLMKLAPHFS